MACVQDKLPARILGHRHYMVKSLCHTPFCHLCRNRVEAVVVLDNTAGGNPLHACKDCLAEMLEGFDDLAPAEKVHLA